MMLKLLLLAAFVLCGHGSEEDGGRVVGGTDSECRAWPSQISLQYSSGGQWYHICGGTLVTPNWVMTAAHCMTSSRTLRAVAGEHDFSHNDGTEQYLSVGRVFVHQYWNSNNITAGYDIALLQLSQSATLNSYVQPGALPGAGQILPNNYPCYITGWGLTKASGQVSPILQQASVHIVSYNICSSPSYWGSMVKTSMVCAQSDDISARCQRESGGPLHCQVNGTYYIHGVTAFGSALSCNVSPKPIVFTRVSAYISWINSIINSN